MYGLVIIFGLVTLLAVYATLKAIQSKNILGTVLALATLGIFGFFTVMTVLEHGYPPVIH
ncbi:DUF2759 domain-containing protein [Bacillus sp. 165]|uniref:DUF2759 domain-containing protein n=1 Tax=Bacillus sp. 165 TaxID=1529117 RepID=UPI001ADBA192|nr:DUF2759 domain-containing protein [Bacillus sp. 165]MBO9129641.1 DUF2759 domain-containing protein [Bacillus sp. 165]